MDRQTLSERTPSGRTATRNECIRELRFVAPLSDSLIEMLGMPDRLIRHCNASFSLNGPAMGKEAFDLLDHITPYSPFPDGMLAPLPSYGIVVARHDCKNVCAFTDSGRGIFVARGISGGGQYSWEPFEQALSNVLMLSGAMKDGDFMVSNGTTIRIIKPEAAEPGGAQR